MDLVRAAFVDAGHSCHQMGVSGRGADLIVAKRYLVSVRAMLGAERASHTTQLKWWKTCDRTDGTYPVMVVRGSMGMTIKGWSAWIDLNHLLDRTPEAGVPVRLYLEDFVTMPVD